MAVGRPVYPPSDKRRYLRVSLVVTRVTASERGRTFFGYADNISQGGMFIHTENPRAPGSQVEVEFELPDPIARRVRVRCAVVWSRQHTADCPFKPGMGLRFLDLSPELARAIDRWAIEGEREQQAGRRRR